MRIFTKLVILTFLFGWQISNTFSQGIDIGRIRYEIQKGDDLLSILEKFLKNGRTLEKESELFELNMGRNLQISNWEDLKSGQEIDIYLPISYIDKTKFKEYLKQKKIRQNELRLQQIVDSRWSQSVFTMASFGRFNQLESEIDLKFQQNSPFTLGYATSFKFNRNWSWSASAYLSYLLSAKTSLSTEKVSIRPEIGLNSYLSHSFSSFNLYGGLDFERFTTFNLDSLRSQAIIERDELRLIFASLGVDKYFKSNKQGLLLRASLSTSISSQRISYETGNELDRPFSGMKLILYANTPINKKYFIHFLYKQHILSGPGDLSVSRIGVGFGLKL
ncbi:MAG: hypothetical protein K9K67_07030 [Bacteriovoracaceae bacterium]|nr:hypothetical protein [Bacteriovoracaceae bacterium]